jgi:hypothetical protein
MLPTTKAYAFMREGLLFCAIFNKVCTHSSNGRIQRTSRKSSMSHNTFTTSLFELLACIFTIKGWYSSYTYFVENNMDIHQVFTFLNSLLPLVLNKFASFWNPWNFFRLWAKKHTSFARGLLIETLNPTLTKWLQSSWSCEQNNAF